MKKFLMFVVLVSLVSTDIYGKSSKKSSFGKWNYDKFGHAQKKLSSTETKRVGGTWDACRQYVHVDTKFHVRVKNWFRAIQLGLNGYAEMRATLGTASRSCGIPYNIARMDLFYDYHGHQVATNSSYIRATMQGVGAVHECYKAIGYAFTKDGIVPPKGYRGNFSISVPTGEVPGNLDDLLNASGLGEYAIPGVTNRIKNVWFIPIRFTTKGEVTIVSTPNAGAIMNEEKGCYKVGGNFIDDIKF